MRNSLIFDTVNTLDYGVVIDGEAAFDAPERDVEVVTIPGRNGTLQIDNGRFENIEVTYPASIWADEHGDFKTKIRNLRNAFASKRGYKRLTDTYNTDEYRLGVFKSGLECDPGVYNTAAEFDIVFDCKPQRFLTSGETSVDITSAAAQTLTGNPALFFNATGTTVNGFEVEIAPKITSWGTILPTFTRGEARITANGSTSTVAWSANTSMYTARVDLKAKKVYQTHDAHIFAATDTMSTYTSGGVQFFRMSNSNAGISSSGGQGYCNFLTAVEFTSLSALNDHEITNNGSYIYWRMDNMANVVEMKDFISTVSHGNRLTYLAKRTNAADVTSSVASSTLVVDASNEISNYVVFTEPNLEQYGTVKVTATGPVNLVNETDFEARPLLSVTGTGTVTVGDVTITIGGGGSQMYIDCDIDEAWSYSGGSMVNRNGDVSMSSTEFPSLPPGANVITFSAGITQVLVTPRWWRV